MVNIAHTGIGLLILFVFGVSLLNPGGGMVALAIAMVIIAVMLVVPFAQEYVLSVNKGKAARKAREMSNDSNGGESRK